VKKITKVVEGDILEAPHKCDVEFYRKYAQVEIGEPSNIVIIPFGYPANFINLSKLIIMAEQFVKEGGIIILVAECEAGFGTDLFYE